MDADFTRTAGRNVQLKWLAFFALFLPSSTLAYEGRPLSIDRAKPEVVKSLYRPLSFERVIDGDTFIASDMMIRIWGIDAPEKKERLYRASSKALELFLSEGLLFCKLVELDAYRREVMHCFIGKADLGGLMVKTGFAKDYEKFSGGFYQPEENFAKQGLLGLWDRP